MREHVTLCYMVVVGNLNSPLKLFISFAKALMEQGFPSDLFLAKDKPENANLLYYQAMLLFILKVNGMSPTDWDVAAAAIRKSMAR